MIFFFSFLEIKESLFHTEIIISAIITALIYNVQLFLGMANLRKHIKEYRIKGRQMLEPEKGIKVKEAPFKAIGYPGYLIRYTMGGFVITFHLLIFVAFILRLIWYYYYIFKWILEFILSILILYVLQLLIVQLISKLIITDNQRGQQVANNTEASPARDTPAEVTNIMETSPTRDTPVHCCSCWSQCRPILKNILQYFMLVASKTFLLTDIRSGRNTQIILPILDCFIGIISSIVRLIKGLVINIVSINRIDSWFFSEPFKNWGKTSIRCIL